MPMYIPDFYPKKPNMHRRAPWHDYRSRFIYMITLVKSPHIPVFSSVRHLRDDVYIAEMSPTGWLVQTAISSFRNICPHLRASRRIVMPDHVHILLFVEEYLELHLSRYISIFKAKCLSLFREAYPDFKVPATESFFRSGFHDRLVMRRGQVAAIKKYIDDNPRRLWLKMTNADLFCQSHRVVVDGTEYDARGNIFMLDDIDKVAVRISRSFSDNELITRKRNWLRTIENGGVLVSPFISADEKKVRNYAMENDGRIILIADNGFSPRFKPAGHWFDLCHQGRLLILAPLQYSTTRVKLPRAECLRMNRHAELISANEFTLLY